MMTWLMALLIIFKHMGCYMYHPEWLANPVLVKKKNNNMWRMCVDYTDLNKHYPKDPFGHPRIDQVIDCQTRGSGTAYRHRMF